MNIKKRMSSVMLIIIMLCGMSVTSVLADDEKNTEEGVTILFTHDMHSHMDPYKAEDEDGQTIMIGGLGKLKTLADQKKAENPATFLLDGGDFSMGTLYQTIYETEASELAMMGYVGYDATTFGNHEFDYRSEGISNMLHAAVQSAAQDPQISLPVLVSSNIDWEKNTSRDNLMVKQAMDEYGASSCAVIEHGGVRVGVFGVMGEDADDCAPESGLEFEDIVEASEKAVDQLEEEDVDMIVCLSHSGTNENRKKSEDEILAEKVPEIDVIISGHTHTILEEPIQSGDTYIVSGGPYCENLGELTLTRNENGRWEMKSYSLNRLDETITIDENVTAKLEQYKNKVNSEYLSGFGYTFDQILAENEIEFTQMDEFAETLKEDSLGNMIADAYVYAVQKAEGDDYEKVDVAIAPSGTIRDTFQKGELTVSDAFNVCSLGIGADRIPGYPLVSVYLTGKELKTVAEIDVSVSPLMTSAQLYPSGLNWVYNPNRMILNRVTDVKLVTNVPYSEEKEWVTIKDDQLYRVVAGLYSAQMLGSVEDTSKGILKIVPKDQDGNAIDDFEQYIIHDQGGAEVKEWYALASYLESFEKNQDGISQIPSYYGEYEGRKCENDSKNVMDILKNPNKIAVILYMIILGIVVILVLVVRFLICYTKKHAEKKINKRR